MPPGDVLLRLTIQLRRDSRAPRTAVAQAAQLRGAVKALEAAVLIWLRNSIAQRVARGRWLHFAGGLQWLAKQAWRESLREAQLRIAQQNELRQARLRDTEQRRRELFGEFAAEARRVNEEAAEMTSRSATRLCRSSSDLYRGAATGDFSSRVYSDIHRGVSCNSGAGRAWSCASYGGRAA